jgi:hypothetical protein
MNISPQVQAAANAAFEFGYPLNETMRVCEALPAVNRPFSKTALATPDETTVVLPNNDTLYTVVCVYLGSSWAKLTLPARGDRYMSAAVFGAYSDIVALASVRDIPAQGGTYYLHLTGKSTDGIPAGAKVFEVPTPYSLLMVRALVDGPADLDAAHAIQHGITLTPNSPTQPPRPSLSGSTLAQDFFLKLMLGLAQNPPLAIENDYVATFASAGIRASLTPTVDHVSDEQKAAWEVAYANGFKTIETQQAQAHQRRGGWSFPDPNIAMPGTNYALRAVVARYELFALPPTESIYPRTDGDGHTPRVLHLPSAWPPIEAGGFWSLTMYSNGYLCANPIQRYSIGDRTPGVKKEPDGSLKIYVQSDDPGGPRSANWLPAPRGPYSMTMRLYLPTQGARDSRFTIPSLE